MECNVIKTTSFRSFDSIYIFNPSGELEILVWTWVGMSINIVFCIVCFRLGFLCSWYMVGRNFIFNAGFGMCSHLDWCLDFYSSKCLGMDHDVYESFGPI